MLYNVQCHRYLYPYHNIENTGTYNWKHTWKHTVSNHPIHQHGHTNFWYVCLLERVYSNSKNAAIMCGMYIINGVHGPEPRSSGGNTSPNPRVSALIPRPAFDGMESMCQRHGSNQNSHPPVLVQKPLCNQLIHYHISSRGVFCINHFKPRNFAVVAIESSFATVDKGSIMARIHRWSTVACRLNLNTTVISMGMEHGDSHTGKTTSLYRDGPEGLASYGVDLVIPVYYSKVP